MLFLLRRPRLALLFAMLVLSACQTLGTGSIRNSVTVDIAPSTAKLITDDMVGRLAEQIGPGKGTIRIESDGSPFSQTLETSLRDHGFAVASGRKTQNPEWIELCYVVDDFQDYILVRLAMRNLDLTRMYRVDGQLAIPVSPLSIKRDEA